MKTSAFLAPTPPGGEAITVESDPPQYPALTIEINGTGDADPLLLTFRTPDGVWDVVHPSRTFNRAFFENELTRIRARMFEWSQSYDTYLVDKTNDPVRFRPDLIRDVWRDLAVWGREFYRELFDTRENRDPTLARFGRHLKDRLTGHRIVIDSALGDVPWGLLYDEKVPDELSDDDYLPQLLSHFWHTKYKVEVLPDYPVEYIDWVPELNNLDATRLTVTINGDTEKEYGTGQLPFFQMLARRLDSTGTKTPSPLRLNNARRQVIDSILNRPEPQHLLYFFCHHEKGGGTWTKRGYRNFGDTRILVSGNSPTPEGSLSVKDMNNEEDIKSFSSPPVVFLNACQSAQTDIGDPSGFMYYFVNTLKAYAFVGTEAEIPATFADAFGKRFVEEFLRGHAIGRILSEARAHYASLHNPFGLYYTLYGNVNVRLSREVEETT